MSIPYNDIEKKLIGSFDIHKDIHPLFRAEEESKLKDYNKETLVLENKTTNEEREQELQRKSFIC